MQLQTTPNNSLTIPSHEQSHSKGSHFVDMIKAMVVKNIAPEHVSIVMTLTGMDDVENQVGKVRAQVEGFFMLMFLSLCLNVLAERLRVALLWHTMCHTHSATRCVTTRPST
jgi:hypothetical protein